jgi:1-acyl-sn-glycerol-3-phosphate acyltransferase
MADIMLMLAIIKNHFVGSRNSLRFRCLGFLQTYLYFSDLMRFKKPHASFLTRAQKVNRGLSVCIFPEGGVPDDESILLDTFKDGALECD